MGNMAAASESVNSLQIERVVNRWIVDYYLSLAFDLFKKKQYAEFCEIRDVLNGVTGRPVESTCHFPTKLRVLQFLSRINEGQSLDVSFEHDESILPLESALMLLETISQENNIPQQDVESAHTSIKEMLVATCIKNHNFEKAKEVLTKHFPKAMIGKKAIFMGLVKQKSTTHQVIEDINFQQFKEEMLNFCQTFCTFSVPFLHKAAIQLLDKRCIMQDTTPAELDEREKRGPASNCNPQIRNIQPVLRKGIIIPRSRLEAAYNALAAGLEVKTFAQLEEEMEHEARKENISMQPLPGPMEDTEMDTEQDGLPPRATGSPMEALPAEENGLINAVPQPSNSRGKKRLYTVAQLVVEPDSQNKPGSTTASTELEPEDEVEEPKQAVVPTIEQIPQSPLTQSEVVTKPTRRLPRRSNKICDNVPETSPGSEEEPSLSTSKTSAERHHNQSNSSPHKKSTSKQMLSDCVEDSTTTVASCNSPVQKPSKRQASSPLNNAEDSCNTDSPSDGSLSHFPIHSSPQRSSTPHRKRAHDKDDPHKKWKQLYSNAKESKETWSDEELFFSSKDKDGKLNDSTTSVSAHRKKKWTDKESQRLKEGVLKFGEGNWSKIKSYYNFSDRTNVNLKDRWRTMKKLNIV